MTIIIFNVMQRLLVDLLLIVVFSVCSLTHYG